MGARDTPLPSVLCQRCHQLPLAHVTRKGIGEGKRLWHPVNHGSSPSFPNDNRSSDQPSASRSLSFPIYKAVMMKAPASPEATCPGNVPELLFELRCAQGSPKPVMPATSGEDHPCQAPAWAGYTERSARVSRVQIWDDTPSLVIF